MVDWYERRNELEPGMVFMSNDGLVMLDRSVPGDGTKWYVADWHGGWAYYDGTIEPGDLIHEIGTEADLFAECRNALRANEYRLATADEFDNAADKPDGIAARATLVRKDYGHVVYDPENDENGHMIWGSNPDALAVETVIHLELIDWTE